MDRSKPFTFDNNDMKDAPLWPGWMFENGVIHDPDGNRYTQRDIQLSFDAGRIVDGYYGKPSEIASLKSELKRRAVLNVLPKVVLCYESPDGTEELVFDLVKHLES